jgi:predicted Zn-dependent peptidase
VITLAGSFQDADVAELTARFGAMAPGRPHAGRAARYTPGITVKKKAIEQNHLTLAFPGLPLSDKRRFTLQLLSSILGGGMSSRLFQQVREQRGLCYSIYSYGACHDDTGYFAVYTALGRETESQALDTILQVIRTFTREGVTQAELDRAREQSKANVLMGLESTQAHMSSLGRGELLLGQVLSPDEIIAAYDAVTPQAVQELARELLDFDQVSLSAVGRVDTADGYRALLHS